MGIFDFLLGKANKDSNKPGYYSTRYEALHSMQRYSDLPFDFTNVPFVDSVDSQSVKRYLFENENQKKARDLILSLNSFIDEAQKQCSTVSPNRIEEKDLEFRPVKIPANYPFEFFLINPETKTGKPSKYPMRIIFFHDICKPPFWKSNIFGEVSLLENGDIGKGVINQWYKDTKHGIYLTYKGGETIIEKIETNTVKHTPPERG